MSAKGIRILSSFIILVAENENAATQEDWDVMEFSSLAELKKLRKRHPEKMKGRYFYALSRGVDAQFRHVHVTEADHFKQFMRQIKNTGLTI
ncbi:hypothetical protein ACFDWB_003852 [Salmonella enterica]|nr:hypothetical protein [Salmonella enterica subsp. enterica serovar Glostrup]EHG3080342.1 hypothetical protein [Salmonella enterica]EIG1925269.1 hypothetical protein [Salmonella enterica]EJI4683212.1 hypothetical protein [Salmonella enterica]EKR9561730.1 hypothetical protein [Salmonella enterica]